MIISNTPQKCKYYVVLKLYINRRFEIKTHSHIVATVALKIVFYAKHQFEIELYDVDTWIFSFR